MSLEKVGKILSVPDILESGFKLKAVSKILPSINPFIQSAVAAGYGANQIVDFLKQKLFNQRESRDYERLSSRDRAGLARPDEKAALSKYDKRADRFETLSAIGKVGGEIAGGLGGLASQEEKMQQMQDKLRQSEEKNLAVEAHREFYRDLAERKMGMGQEKFSAQQQAQQAQQQMMQERMGLAREKFGYQQEVDQYSKQFQEEKEIERRAHQNRQENRLLRTEERQQEAHQARMQKMGTQNAPRERKNKPGFLSEERTNRALQGLDDIFLG